MAELAKGFEETLPFSMGGAEADFLSEDIQSERISSLREFDLAEGSIAKPQKNADIPASSQPRTESSRREPSSLRDPRPAELMTPQRKEIEPVAQIGYEWSEQDSKDEDQVGKSLYFGSAISTKGESKAGHFRYVGKTKGTWALQPSDNIELTITPKNNDIREKIASSSRFSDSDREVISSAFAQVMNKGCPSVVERQILTVDRSSDIFQAGLEAGISTIGREAYVLQTKLMERLTSMAGTSASILTAINQLNSCCAKQSDVGDLMGELTRIKSRPGEGSEGLESSSEDEDFYEELTNEAKQYTVNVRGVQDWDQFKESSPADIIQAIYRTGYNDNKMEKPPQIHKLTYKPLE